MTTAPPPYTWTVTDHRKTSVTTGYATTRTEAQATAETAVRRLGRGLNGVQATVFRPSGGGWFARDGKGSSIRWEAWEQEKIA